MAASSWYSTAAVPVSEQPDYINGVIIVESGLEPRACLARLQEIEARVGRVRWERNAARVLDLDLVAAGDLVMESEVLTLPHPRMAERAFVLEPLCEIAPGWRHPVLGLTARELRDRIGGQRVAWAAAA